MQRIVVDEGQLEASMDLRAVSPQLDLYNGQWPIRAEPALLDAVRAAGADTAWSWWRRGRPAAHVRFAEWHQDNGLNGSAERFGASAAVLLGDLCLVWAGQMMRESGLGASALGRAWPRYDAMRTELAVGQFADLVNDAGGRPTLEDVLDVARRKSGNYTVRRPLEIGGALAGAAPDDVQVLLLCLI